MAGDPLKKVQPGDSLDPVKSAQTFNCFIDAALDFKARTQGLRRKAPDITPQRSVIPVKNMTGGIRNRFDVAAIGQSLFDINGDAGKERPAAFGLEPDVESHLGKIAVFIEPAGVGDIARCCVSGVTVARVSVVEKWHRWADFKDGECEYLESRGEPGGVYILWPTGQTGTLLCLVRISNPPPVHFAAKITAVEALGENRYKYTFVENRKSAALHAGWTTKSEGRSGYAYNLVETVGDPTCVPAKVNETVWIDEVHFTGEGGDKETEYWFQYEEYDQDDGSDGDGSDGDGLGGAGYIDVHICGGWNRCGSYIVIKQKRIHYDARGNITKIEALPNDVIPIWVCESSGGDGSDYLPPDSSNPQSEYWYLWWSTGYGAWAISRSPGNFAPQWWIGTPNQGLTDPDDQNPYTHGGTATGDATVTDVGPYGFAVTGTLNPDVTGNFVFEGAFGGKPYYKKTIIILP